jgi:transcriptional regulator EpsA
MKLSLTSKAEKHDAQRDSFKQHTAVRAGLLDSAPIEIDEPFSRVVASSRDISRPSHLLEWLQGELQQLIPHQILIVAWGHFLSEDVRYNVVSLPGAEVNPFPHREISPMLRRLYGRWVTYGRQAFGLRNAALGSEGTGLPKEKLPQGFSGMRSVLVHGMRDEHTGRDRMYVTLHSDAAMPADASKTFQILMPCIDRVLRRISTLRTHQKPSDTASPHTVISEREREILGWVRKGKTNQEIGVILGISQFTVKNHLQRIFRKLDVLNRAQAIGKFSGDGDAQLHSFFP